MNRNLCLATVLFMLALPALPYPGLADDEVGDHQKARKAMAGVRAPTLLIRGGRDALLIPAAAGILGGYLENTRVSTVFMPDVGHYPPLESPLRFAKIVAAYIEGATPNATP